MLVSRNLEVESFGYLHFFWMIRRKRNDSIDNHGKLEQLCSMKIKKKKYTCIYKRETKVKISKKICDQIMKKSLTVKN